MFEFVSNRRDRRERDNLYYIQDIKNASFARTKSNEQLSRLAFLSLTLSLSFLPPALFLSILLFLLLKWNRSNGIAVKDLRKGSIFQINIFSVYDVIITIIKSELERAESRKDNKWIYKF